MSEFLKKRHMTGEETSKVLGQMIASGQIELSQPGERLYSSEEVAAELGIALPKPTDKDS